MEQRYGGKRRQVAIYLEDLDKFPQIRPGNAQDLEQFADLLEIAIMNLNETGYHNELGNGKLRTKLTESMLAKYYRWVFETQTPESVVAFKAWVFHESAFQTIASETVHGITGTFRNHQSTPASPTCNSQRTFFGKMIDYHSKKKCVLPDMQKGSQNLDLCENRGKCVSKRWDAAKCFKLCFRCLGDGHRGKSCPRSLPCRENTCKKLHPVLLHRNDDRQVKATSKCYILNKCFPTKTCHNPYEARRIMINKLDRGLEGNDKPKASQMETQDDYSADFSGLPTVPVAMTQRDTICKVGNATIKHCTKTGIALELQNQSDNMISDRNCTGMQH